MFLRAMCSVSASASFRLTCILRVGYTQAYKRPVPTGAAMPPRARKYAPELRELAVRMVETERPGYASDWAAIRAVADKLGIRSPETLRKWVADSRSRQRPTGGAKRLWLPTLRKLVFRQHPIIAGAVVTLLGGLGLAYSQLLIGSNDPALAVDQVNVSNSHSLSTVDIKLINNG